MIVSHRGKRVFEIRRFFHFVREISREDEKEQRHKDFYHQIIKSAHHQINYF